MVFAALITEVVYQPPYWLHAALWLPLILLVTLVPLRLIKGLLIALQYHHKAAEGRLDASGRRLSVAQPRRRRRRARADGVRAGRRRHPDRARHLAARPQGLEGKSDRDVDHAACPRAAGFAAARELAAAAAGGQRIYPREISRRISRRPGGAGLHRRLRLPARRAWAGLLGVRAGAACRRQHRVGRPRLRAARAQGSGEPREGAPHGSIDIVGVMRWPETRGLFTPADEPQNNVWYLRDSTAIAAAKKWATAAPFYIEQESPVPPGGLPQAGQAASRTCPTIICNTPSPGSAWRPALAGVYVVWLAGRLRRGA